MLDQSVNTSLDMESTPSVSVAKIDLKEILRRQLFECPGIHEKRVATVPVGREEIFMI